jgi:4-amino-4-deoxy-L-arabinose transferase-like glycosyltransferase
MGWALLIVATLYICYFSHLGAVGFVGPDEPRYAWIARAMVESGDWVTPRLYGQPWFEKPVLYYWEAALSFKLFGVSEAAARLPSAISALLATLALAWLALRIYGTETARWLLLLLPTTVGMIGFSHAAATDMPFSGMLTVAMVCARVVLGLARNERSPVLPRTPWLALILFGFFLGLAVLAKGPAGVILCGGTVFFWALFTKRWRDAFRLLHPIAIGVFCLTALPWYLLCARRNPTFFHVFIIEHNFKRFLTPEFQHIQPFWYYIPIVLIALLPWVALLLWALLLGLRQGVRNQQVSPNTAYFLCWSVFCCVFFSISKSKLPGYVLPAIPAIAMLIVRIKASLLPVYRRSFRFAHLGALILMVTPLSVIVSVAPKMSSINKRFGIAVASLLLLIALGNLILGILDSEGKFPVKQLFAALCVLPILVAVSQTNRYVSVLFPWDPSGRTIARELNRQEIPLDQLVVSSMRRGQQYSLSFYVHREVGKLNPGHPIDGGYLLLNSGRCAELAGSRYSCRKLPFDSKTTGYFLFKLEANSNLVPGAGSGKPQ